MRHQDAGRTSRAVVFLERVIELTVHGVGRADHHEWPARGQQAGTNGSENLNIRIGEVGRGEPESHLIRYDRDIGRAAQSLEIARSHLDGDAILKLNTVLGAILNQTTQIWAGLEDALAIAENNSSNALVAGNEKRSSDFTRRQHAAVITQRGEPA